MTLNTGIYTASEAASLLHEDPRTVRRWAFGSGRDGSGRRALIRTDLPPCEGQRALTFLELIELLYVRAFHELGVPWSAIRAGARESAHRFGSPHPFALRQAYLDPASVLPATEANGGEAVARLSGDAVTPYLGQIEFGADDVAARWWPRGKEGGVSLDPRHAFGAPVVAATGIPAETLTKMYDAEEPAYGRSTAARVAWIYEIEPKHVYSALAFRQWLRAA